MSKLSQKPAAKRARKRYAKDPVYRAKVLKHNRDRWATEKASSDAERVRKRQARQRKASAQYRATHPQKSRAYSRQWSRNRLPKVSKAELELYRADPKRPENVAINIVWRGEQFSKGCGEYIVCPECGGILESLGQHVWQCHGMRAWKFRAKWPDMPRISLEHKNRSSEATKKARKGKLLPFPEPLPAPGGRPQASQRKQETDERIDLAGRLLAEGVQENRNVSQRSISLILFPDHKDTPDEAYQNTRQLFSRFRNEIQAVRDRYLALRTEPSA